MMGSKRYSVGFNRAFLAEPEPRSTELKRYVSTSHLHHRAALRAKVIPTSACSRSPSSPNLAIGGHADVAGQWNGGANEQWNKDQQSSALVLAGTMLARRRPMPPKVIFLLGGPASGVENITNRLTATFVGLALLAHSGDAPSGAVALLKKQIEESSADCFLVKDFPCNIAEHEEWVHQMGGQVDDFALFLDVSRETLGKRFVSGCPSSQAFARYDNLLPVVAAFKKANKLLSVLGDEPRQFERIYEECEYAVVQLLRPRQARSHPLAGCRLNVNATWKAPFLRTPVPLMSAINTPYASSSSKEDLPAREIHILHFNDVYNIEESDGDVCGGIARFLRLVQDFRQRHPLSLVMFSGDGFSPSIMSTATRGKHMVKALNSLGIDCAVYGNHDFDFGLEELEDLAGECNFPWLMSNVWHKPSDSLLAHGLEYKTFVVNGMKIGCIGVVEEDWLVTLSAIDEEECAYEDFVVTSRRLAKALKAAPHDCDVVIALTHMRLPNDVRLCQECKEIDLVLGGHDHHYEVREIPPYNTLMVKSGADFRQATEVRLCLNGGALSTSWNRRDVRRNMPQDPLMARYVEECTESMKESMEEVVGHSVVDLDGRFDIVRSQESNLGNFIADSVRAALKVDTVVINGGCIRSGAITVAGNITKKDLMSWLPIQSELMVLELTGSQLLATLEAGFSAYPQMEGRFPQVSGLKVAFDPSLPPQRRVRDVAVQRFSSDEWEPLHATSTYSFASTSYLCSGKDGYGVLQSGKVLRDTELCGILPLHVRNTLRSHIVKCALNRLKNLVHTRRLSFINHATQFGSSIAPQVEGRIVIL